MSRPTTLCLRGCYVGMCLECEHLIRHMLVKDPEKRYTIEQIKKHRWLLADGVPRPIQGFARSGQKAGLVEEYSEQVLRLMESLGMERNKTIEVSMTTRFCYYHLHTLICSITTHHQAVRHHNLSLFLFLSSDGLNFSPVGITALNLNF